MRVFSEINKDQQKKKTTTTATTTNKQTNKQKVWSSAFRLG